MQHETATVKKKIKSYTLKDGAEKESISYTINLGVNSKFDGDDKVAVIPIADFNEISGVTANEIKDLKNIIAEKDATITANTESIDELNKKVKNKSVLINDLTGKLNSSEKTVADLESDISKKDEKIAELKSKLRELKSNIANKDETIATLNAKNNELNKSLTTANSELGVKDKTISNLEKEIAVFDAIDVDGLQKKVDELDKSKNVIIKLQKDSNNLQLKLNEYLLLVNFKDKKITALENKGVLDTLFSKDVTADIVEPTLSLIDLYGNPIADADNSEVNATANSGENVANDGAESKPELK